MVKTSPSNVEGMGSIPGGGAKIPHASQPKNQNRSNVVTNSIKTLKMVHIKKIFKIISSDLFYFFNVATRKF